MATNPLSKLSQEEFSEVVALDIRDNATKTQSKYLRTPEIADRWYQELLARKRSVEAQFSASRAERIQKIIEAKDNKTVAVMIQPPRENRPATYEDMTFDEYLAYSEKWRSGAIYFLSGIENRLAESKRFRISNAVNKYASAIREHKESFTAEDEETWSAEDEKLWAVLEP